MDLGLKGKVAFVTGGGSGIGAGISEALAQEGARVCVSYRSRDEEARAFAAALGRQYGTDCQAFQMDVTNTPDLDRLVSGLLVACGDIDILVNNAGVWPTENVLDMPDEHWEEVIATNLNGPFMLAKRVARYMVGAGHGGSVINLSSKSSMSYNTIGHAHYATAKAALNMMTRSMARELAPYGIRVNAVAPGMVRTPINEDKWADPELKKTYESGIPAGWFALPIEIGYTVAFLASDKAFNITGTVIDATGGMLI